MPFTNLTIQVPPGATQHNNPYTLCIRGPPWKSTFYVITFFAANYISHAATVKSSPGEGPIITVCNIILALCFPMFGLLRALNSIARGARFGGSELKNACRAGALCMVVRGSDWMPDTGQVIEAVVAEDEIPGEDPGAGSGSRSDPVDTNIINYFPPYAREDSSAWAYFDTIGSRAYADPQLTRIHGTYNLPRGYTFAIVPRNTRLQNMKDISTLLITNKDEGSTRNAANEIRPAYDGYNDTASISSKTTFATNEPARDQTHMITIDTDSTADNIDRASQALHGPSPTGTGQNSTINNMESDISSSWNPAKAIVSLLQALAAIYTLLLHRSDLIDRWGYASFHLTVIPYLIMTLLNFISNIVTGDYACLYMVESEIMREAKGRGGFFMGTVAAVEELHHQAPCVSSAKELKTWRGVKLRHIQWLAAALNIDLSAVVIDRRRRKQCISNVRLTFQEAIGPAEDAPEATDASQQPRNSTRNNAVHPNPISCLDGHSVSKRQAVTRAERHTSEGSSTSCDDIELRSQMILSSQHEDEGGSSSIRHSSDFETVPQFSESAITLQSETGKMYRIQQHHAASKKFSELLLPNGPLKGQPPIPMQEFKGLPRYLQKVLSVLYYVLGTDNPARMRLLNALIHLHENCEDGDWKTRLRVLAKDVFDGTFQGRKQGRARRAKIYIPNCSIFARDDAGPEHKPKGLGNVGVMMTVEILFGCAILGLVILLVAGLSHWFSRGQSSPTERVIMLLWICEGAFGLLLPLISIKELMMVIILLPFYALIAKNPTIHTYLVYAAFMPVGIFIAPVWGFVIVGKMLVEWGNCINLN